MGDTLLFLSEYCQRTSMLLCRFDDAQRPVSHAGSRAFVGMHKETRLLRATRRTHFVQVFLLSADTSGVTTRKAAFRPALRPDVKAQPRW